jgi:hypothetical protein
MAAPNDKCRAQLVVYDGAQSQSPIQLYWNDVVDQYRSPYSSYFLFWDSQKWIIEDGTSQQWTGGSGYDDLTGSYAGYSSTSAGSSLTIQVSVYDSPCSPPTSSSSSSSGSAKSYSSVSEGEGNP